MLLSRAATLLGAVVLLSATVASADKNEGRKKKGIFGKLMERDQHTNGIGGAGAGDNVNANDGTILAEDEGYWERFLQATIDSIPSTMPSSPPTPGPQCDVTVSIIVYDQNDIYLLRAA